VSSGTLSLNSISRELLYNVCNLFDFVIVVILFCCLYGVYQVHVGSVRQTATIMSMSKDHLRTGDKAVVRFKFIKNPEYLRPDIRLVFREGRTKAVGTVTQIVPYTSVASGGSRQSRSNVSTAAGQLPRCGPTTLLTVSRWRSWWSGRRPFRKRRLFPFVIFTKKLSSLAFYDLVIYITLFDFG